MADIKKTTYYRYTSEVDRVFNCIKDFLDDNSGNLFSSVEVTTNDYNEPCLKISYTNDSYITISFNNQITGEGNNFAIEFFNKEYSNITNNGNRQSIGGSGRGYCIQLANVSFNDTDIWYGEVNSKIFIASTAHIGIRSGNGDFNKLSFIIFNSDKSIIAQSWNGTSWDSIYSPNLVETSGKIAVLIPFITNVYEVEDYGCGENTPFAVEYTNEYQGNYWYEVPTRLTMDEDTYIIFGGLAIKE